MTLSIKSIPVPLRVDEYGATRVGDSRITLDVVVYEFNNGSDPESIVHDYPVLQLADVYTVIAWYLRNRAEVDAYLHARMQQAAILHQAIESTQPDASEFWAKLRKREAESSGSIRTGESGD